MKSMCQLCITNWSIHTYRPTRKRSGTGLAHRQARPELLVHPEVVFPTIDERDREGNHRPSATKAFPSAAMQSVYTKRPSSPLFTFQDQDDWYRKGIGEWTAGSCWR